MYFSEADMIHTSLLISNFAVPRKKKEVMVRNKEEQVGNGFFCFLIKNLDGTALTASCK